MNYNHSLKYILLFLLIVNFAIQSVEAYSYIKLDSRIASIVQPAQPVQVIQANPANPAKREAYVVSSNVIMVWNIDSETIGSHSLDKEHFAKLQALARSMSTSQFKSITDKAENISTKEFFSVLDSPEFEEQIQLAMLSTPN